MNRRFTALRVIGTLLKVLAWIALVLGFLVAALLLILGLTVQRPLGIDQIQKARSARPKRLQFHLQGLPGLGD